MHACMLSCVWLFVTMDCSPPGSLIHGIFQARILEWVAISYSRGSSPLRDGTQVSYISCISRWITTLPPGKPKNQWSCATCLFFSGLLCHHQRQKRKVHVKSHGTSHHSSSLLHYVQTPSSWNESNLANPTKLTTCFGTLDIKRGISCLTDNISVVETYIPTF